MSAVAELPNRRVEGWRWSDLRAALPGVTAPELAETQHVLAGLAVEAGRFEKIDVGAGETETRVERVGEGATDMRALEIEIGANGRLDLVTLLSGDGVATAHRKVTIAAGGEFRHFVLTPGGKYSRVETEVDLAGEGGRVAMDGVSLAGAGLHSDQTSSVTLSAEGGEVRQLVRGVARKRGRGVFQGKFLVERAAQKTDAQMAHNALLLEDGAEIFAKPELEIYADDVQCAHGNTCGQLDEQAIFYARQRGLPEADARAMLTRAFLVEAIPDWLDEDLRAEVETRIDAWLGAS